ncbi:hypothetical protein EMPS_00150 [Entomortierella parvispora]|uniref:F-box domain-containing protein n=1 Tax=Entomortierella parvispora TaxID=205924 RepID=A0A9P3GZH9_9FUNG|nr:hypothetical protein EMPS_00150 [Entomortierella parvispora]
MSSTATDTPWDVESFDGASYDRHSEGADDLPKVSSLSMEEPDTHSDVLPAVVHQIFPIEVWCEICRYLYPSQLSRLSRACKASRSAVCNMDFWRWLFEKTYPDGKTKLCFLPCVPESQSYMQYMCAISLVICEQCLNYHRHDFSDLAEMPLPVPAPSQTRCTESVKYLGEPIDTGFTARLCLPCRKAFYAVYDEPLPDEVEFEVMSLEMAREKYPYCGLPTEETPTMVKYNGSYRQGMFLEMARKTQGGDVGVGASKSTAQSYPARLRNSIRKYHDLHRALSKIL